MASELEVEDPLSGLVRENVALFLDVDGTLLDIPADKVSIARLPPAPQGMNVERVDVVVRVRR